MYIKDSVYVPPIPATLQDLRDRIVTAIRSKLQSTPQNSTPDASKQDQALIRGLTEDFCDARGNTAGNCH
ncbi:hypothetical protein AVEN_16493-1, partial [Araneus ventricosus]